MIPALIELLIVVGFIALFIVIVLWAMRSFGVALPARAEQIIWAIFALIVLLLIAQLFFGGGRLHLGLM